MHILFCNFEYPPLGGGGGDVNALLAQELAQRHQVTVLTSQALDLPREAEEGGVRVLRVPILFRRRRATASLLSMLSYLLLAPGAGGRRLTRGQFSVVNTHFALPSGPVGERIARHLGVPNVLSVHGGDLYDPSKFTSPHRHLLLRRWIGRLVRKADAVVGQSRNTLENLRRYYAPEIEGVRIPLGIRRPVEGVAARESYGLGTDEILLVSVGRIVARKAVEQLLQVVDSLPDLPVRLLLLGSGPRIPALRQECRQRGLGERVLFLGQIEDAEKTRILRMCDLFVSTSQHEGFGLVFLEAMACGLPVVCYGSGGQTDFLVDQSTGFVLPLNDLDRFVSGCRQLAVDPELRRRMGAENLRRVEEYFIEQCARRYEELFEQISRRSS